MVGGRRDCCRRHVCVRGGVVSGPTDDELRIWDLGAARTLGHNQAQQGFGRDDYTFDYSDAEREAWQRGWDEYQEGRE